MTGRLPRADGVVPVRDFRASYARSMGETELQNLVLNLAGQLGWLPYHTYDSRHSHKGFPDLVLANARQGRLLFAELKKQSGSQSAEQIVWERTLRAIGLGEVYLWRPSDWIDDTIHNLLLSPRPPRSAL